MFKIGIICPSDFSRKERSGGASGFLASIFSELRCSVAIYGVGLNNNQTWQEFSIQPNINFIPITNIKAPSLLPLRLQALIGYLRYRNRILQSKLDVLYVHSPECALPFIFCNKRIPVIFHQHGSGNPVQTATYQWGRIKIFIKIFDVMLRLIHKRADWIIAIDNICLNQARRNGAGNKVSLLFNAVDTTFFRPDFSTRQAMRRKFGLTDNHFVIFFAGRLEEIKRIDRAIDAIDHLKYEKNSYRLYIAGTGSLRNILGMHVSKKQLQPYITFLGHVPHNELQSFYNMADALILPSQMEGTPMVILEALACGTPVVASKVGGIPSIIVNHVNGIVLDDVSPVNLAAAIKEVYSLDLHRQPIADSVQQHNSYQFVAKLEKIIKQLIQVKKGRHVK